MTTVAFPALSSAEQVFKDLVWDPLIKTGELALEGAVPLLNLPIIKQLDEFILGQLADWIFGQIVLLIDIEAIKFVNEEHQKVYTDAAEKLLIVIHDQGVGSEAYQKARDDAKQAFITWVRIGATKQLRIGSSSVH